MGGGLFVPEPVGLHTRRHASHFHTTPEFFLHTGGATDFECPSGSFRLQTGDVCVIHRQECLTRKLLSNLRTPYGVIVLMNHAAGCMLLRGWADESRRIQSGDFLASPLPIKAFSFLEEASNQHRLPKSLQRGFSTGLVTAFLVSVLSGLNTDTAQQESTSTPLVAEVEKIIRVEISRSDLSVASLASRVGCLEDHLTRRFRAERGVALNAWITRERIDSPATCLRGPNTILPKSDGPADFQAPRISSASSGGINPKRVFLDRRTGVTRLTGTVSESGEPHKTIQWDSL